MADSRLLLPSFLATLMVASTASAFCRTTTCDPRQEECARDASNCIVEGVPLAWPDRCLSFGTQKDGSPLRGISYPEADRIFQEVFHTWQTADCGGGRTPSFRMYDIGARFGGILCDQPEFNDLGPNASIWMFRDDGWPYYDDQATLGLTTVQYEKSTGVILDADVEINSFGTPLTIGDTGIQSDLASIATHEAGHFLGLSHTNSPGATMIATYQPNSLDIRSLGPDDMDGICAAYPPERDVVECSGPYPPHGFTLYCGGGQRDEGFGGCAVHGAAERQGPHDAAALAAAGIVLALRRRQRARAANGR